VSGDEIAQLKDKRFEIVEEPRYEQLPDLEDNTKTREKLVMTIRTTAGTSEYYPNKTSQRTIMERVGRDLSKWINYKGIFIIKEMMVGKLPKNVIFVK